MPLRHLCHRRSGRSKREMVGLVYPYRWSDRRANRCLSSQLRRARSSRNSGSNSGISFSQYHKRDIRSYESLPLCIRSCALPYGPLSNGWSNKRSNFSRRWRKRGRPDRRSNMYYIYALRNSRTRVAVL